MDRSEKQVIGLGLRPNDLWFSKSNTPPHYKKLQLFSNYLLSTVDIIRVIHPTGHYPKNRTSSERVDINDRNEKTVRTAFAILTVPVM